MIRSRILAPAVAGIVAIQALRAQYAAEVVGYGPGTGGAPGLSNPAAALGEPSRVTPGLFGGPVDPFAPPYTSSQLVSIGSGGSLSVRFATPIQDDPFNPHGLDFSIFGGAGLLVTNAFDADFNYIGTPATDGTLFNPNTGSTRVSVSADGVTWYRLDPARAPRVDDYFPTDGAGDFTRPIAPSLTPGSLAGLTLDQIRIAYGGSAGGSAYDIAWAIDDANTPVHLGSISFVRVEALSGRAEIDGFAAVAAVPEPGVIPLGVAGAAVLLAARRCRRQGR